MPAFLPLFQKPLQALAVIPIAWDSSMVFR